MDLTHLTCQDILMLMGGSKRRPYWGVQAIVDIWHAASWIFRCGFDYFPFYGVNWDAVCSCFLQDHQVTMGCQTTWTLVSTGTRALSSRSQTTRFYKWLLQRSFFLKLLLNRDIFNSANVILKLVCLWKERFSLSWKLKNIMIIIHKLKFREPLSLFI